MFIGNFEKRLNIPRNIYFFYFVISSGVREKVPQKLAYNASAVITLIYFQKGFYIIEKSMWTVLARCYLMELLDKIIINLFIYKRF